MPRNTRSKHFSFRLDNDPCIEYFRCDCMICFVALSLVNRRLHTLLAKDVDLLHKKLILSFEGNVRMNEAYRLSEYITVVAGAVRPMPALPGIMEGRPPFVNLDFYVKTGIVPSKRWRKGSIEGYEKITFYDKSSFPTINEQALFIPSSNWFCSEIEWPPPDHVSIKIAFDGLILKKHFHLRCLA